MKIDYHRIYSKKLGEDFEFKTYGQYGKPLMVFPSSCGRFFDFEDKGMIQALEPYIEAHDIQVIAVDSRDSQSWFKDPKDHFMGINHRNFEICITNEIIPWLKDHLGIKEKLMTTGVSWGGYHALNFTLKFPDLFDTAISLSGAYTLRNVIGDYYDEHVYYNDMLRYMPNLKDSAIISKLQKSYFFIVHGKGNWENCNHEAWDLAQTMGKLNIPHHYSVWSEQYPHDWNAWLEQLPFFCNLIKNGVEYEGKQKIIIGSNREIAHLETL